MWWIPPVRLLRRFEVWLHVCGGGWWLASAYSLSQPLSYSSSCALRRFSTSPCNSASLRLAYANYLACSIVLCPAATWALILPFAFSRALSCAWTSARVFSPTPSCCLDIVAFLLLVHLRLCPFCAGLPCLVVSVKVKVLYSWIVWSWAIGSVFSFERLVFEVVGSGSVFAPEVAAFFLFAGAIEGCWSSWEDGGRLCWDLKVSQIEKVKKFSLLNEMILYALTKS